MHNGIICGLFILAIIACGKPGGLVPYELAETQSHRPQAVSDESVVGNGGNDLTISFLFYARHTYRLEKSLEFIETIDPQYRGLFFQWLATGEVRVLPVKDVSGGGTENVGLDPIFKKAVLNIDEGYWKEALDTYSSIHPQDTGRVWNSLVDLAIEAEVIPAAARVRSASSFPSSGDPTRLRPAYTPVSRTDTELYILVQSALVEDLLPLLKSDSNSRIFKPSSLQAVVNFLEEHKFKFILNREGMTDVYSRPVHARIVQTNSESTCELDRNRLSAYFSVSGKIDPVKIPHLFHEVLREASLRKLIDEKDDFYRYSSQLRLSKGPWGSPF